MMPRLAPKSGANLGHPAIGIPAQSIVEVLSDAGFRVGLVSQPAQHVVAVGSGPRPAAVRLAGQVSACRRILSEMSDQVVVRTS